MRVQQTATITADDELTAAQVKALDDDADEWEDAEHVLPTTAPETSWSGPQVYRWAVPGADGYALVIEIGACDTIDEARRVALGYQVGYVSDEAPGRPLTALEANWITSTAPEIVRERLTVTLEHATALHRNELLAIENETYTAAKYAFARHGIDPADPSAWINRMLDGARAEIAAADSLRGIKVLALVARLQAVSKAVQAAIDSDPDFAPPKAVLPAEPDYSGLHILADVAPADAAKKYPRLAAANFIDCPPDAPLTPDEQKGFDLLFEEFGGGLAGNYRFSKAAANEIEPIDAITRRMRAMVAQIGKE